MKNIILTGLFNLFVLLVIAQHPTAIIDVNNGLLLGGAKKGNLMNADEVSPFLKGGENYKLYSLIGFIQTTTGEKPETYGPPCESTFFVNLEYKPLKSDLYVTGIVCNWDPFPKTLKILSTKQKVYEDITSNILNQYDIINTVIELTNVIRTDLENDGVEEVLISATHYKDGLTPDGKAGDYSMIYLRKIINGKVENIVIESNTYSNDINSVVPSRFKIANILDLNNDGIMEIIIFSEYYEGYNYSIYQIIDNKPIQVLSAGCGA